MSLFLEASEIVELTDKMTRPAQEKRLHELGISFEPGRPPKVLRSVLEGRAHVVPSASIMYDGYAAEPDFSVFASQA
jgi:hypothetical protein